MSDHHHEVYQLSFSDKIAVLGRIAQWGIRRYITGYDTSFKYTVTGHPKFMGVQEAVDKFIKSGDVIASSGLGGNQPLSVFTTAIKQSYLRTKKPGNLTIVVVGGMGARGKGPGTLEDLGIEGLVTRIFTGHAETFKSYLNLADAGKLEFQIIPQGTMCLILGEQAHSGKNYVISDTGRGTFLDISQGGRGTPLRPVNAQQYVEVLDNGMFKYSLPNITVAMYTAPAADEKGNIYLRGASLVSESYEIAKAAKRNGGRVIVMVGLIVPEGYGDVHMRPDEYDALIYHPQTEQTVAAVHQHPWPQMTCPNMAVRGEEFAPQSGGIVGGPARDAKSLSISTEKGIEELRYVNTTLKITPTRDEADRCLGRLAAQIFVENAWKGMSCDIGVGIPEVTSALLYEGGVMDELVMINESGVFGGIASPGVFFGAAVNPTEMISSTQTFRRIYNSLDSVILGALEVDNLGNVNVSKRGEGAINFVGPGGFIDLVHNAKLIVFCCTFLTAPAKFDVKDGRIRVVGKGRSKFIERVDEITFNGQEALAKGKKVFYITHVGAFQLTKQGLMLVRVMPGIDVEKDIRQNASLRIALPPGGKVPVADESVVSGKNFKLNLKPKPKL